MSITASLSLPSKPPPLNPKSQNPPNEALLYLQKCTSMSELKQIHGHMIRSGVAFQTLPASHLVSLCATEHFCSVDYARLVFSQIPNPNTFTSNSIIRGYTNINSPRDALSFYVKLIETGLGPDNFTLPSLFKCCRDLDEGKQLHSHAIKFGFCSDAYVQNTLMNMYATRGCLSSARRVFDKMCNRTVVSWATMIAASARWNRLAEALDLYRRMEAEDVEANEITLVNVLTACAKARDFSTARRVHRYIRAKGICFNVVLMAALLDVYCKSGRVAFARELFDEMPDKNLFCWNIMIKGHVEDGDYQEALGLFQEMQNMSIKADKITMASLVLACSQLGALELGKWLHAYVNREDIEVDVILGSAMVDMYLKCGCIETAMDVFQQMDKKDVTTWTATIRGLAVCGDWAKALEMFDEMQRSGVKPDALTFIGVLTACSNAGLVDEGCAHFDSMSLVYSIQPTVEHYGCMVDLFGRAGLIDRAEELITGMPMAPDDRVLESLLGACKSHGNVTVAERTAQKLLELHPGKGEIYVMLSNMYGSLKRWDEVEKVRKLMLERNVKKLTSCCVIEVKGKVHEFVMGDESHPRSSEIYAMVEDMMCRLKAAGCEPNKSRVVFDLDEEEKEHDSRHHSEKLAIGFGLISTSPGNPIRVTKNLRVCSDCHAAMKLIAKVYDREIIVRDRCRLHFFKDGSCSCKDFW